MNIPFNKPYMCGKELWYISQAHHLGKLAGDGYFTSMCHRWLETHTKCKKALLTHSCTAALEMSAILADISPGDEIIMPSFTFVSTANAFVLRGGVPVFVDIRKDTLNIDETKIEEAITSKTRAIVPVHYAGIACEMDAILDIAKRKNLVVIEDAAQGIMSTYRGAPLGSLGHIGCFSFHETKNIISGEGGAILINSGEYESRAEIIREKGTNRSQFFRGEVDKYTWVDIGSSFLPGELIAAFLFAQMEDSSKITQNRIEVWNQYHQAFSELELMGRCRRPIVPPHCTHNAHIYYLLLEDLKQRSEFIQFLKERGIQSVFHYVPLHNSPAGVRYGRCGGSLSITECYSDRLVRIPVWPGIDEKCHFVIDAVREFFFSK